MSALSLSLIPAISLAANIRDIAIEEPYYINNYFVDNDFVVVKQIDRNLGLVEVQYENGKIDWINPAKILTKTEVEYADIQERIIERSILYRNNSYTTVSPVRFDYAMHGGDNKMDSIKKMENDNMIQLEDASENKIDLIAILFAPIVSGKWKKQGDDWVEWARIALKNDLYKLIEIESVRTKQIPFYSSGNRNVLLVEATQPDHAGAYYLMAVEGKSTKVVLDGQGAPIHQINKHTRLSIDTASTAVEYLKFFTSSIAGNKDIFFVLDPDAGYVPAAIRNQVEMNPINVQNGNNDDWLVMADVIFGDSVYQAEFSVSRGGSVEMTNDLLKQKVTLGYQVVMDGSKRIIVKQQ